MRQCASAHTLSSGWDVEASCPSGYEEERRERTRIERGQERKSKRYDMMKRRTRG